MNLLQINEVNPGRWTFQVLLVVTSVFLAEIAFGQHQRDRSWSVYKADAGSSNYSPLDQINVSNVSQLKPAWT
jgi:quinoprotein glucose dehydrogenase